MWSPVFERVVSGEGREGGAEGWILRQDEASDVEAMTGACSCESVTRQPAERHGGYQRNITRQRIGDGRLQVFGEDGWLVSHEERALALLLGQEGPSIVARSGRSAP